ncbi:1-(5-phosphoribosyl)-5-[(5-phosphoribosylamino)methylideneamino]imidazole-4-carboxamide isomerase [Legionella israelensis]|uniref:1-(5-phosphoribosyl)-5-[(5- phosphoribosylamino)methylideneamino]imidazole-4- carboxamide isomerase n=1 Tax=Legionella israelensis TaxID=454 RepID=UPI00117FE76F|nr:1-(5-phosphoribosyl)-5-[(5-phosphoribosylamino)methylideneamino]imidazole-4-carboxamide isomerase [Legionella israelensis]QDP72003.1 1-(5-phosphoribosyl)-5-[(5-phosphoribosylamino)methylideneamino]imidazole-4-carboxamide isomerase [Legionella israelensis]
MLIIPAIDIYQGQCVRLRQGRFNEMTIYPERPETLAARYTKQGIKRLHLVDLEGAKAGEMKQLPLMSTIAASTIKVQAGGGIRSLAAAEACLKTGVEQLVIGSIAVTDRDLTSKIIQKVQPERVILALDVRIEDKLPQLSVHGWQTSTKHHLWDVVNEYQQLGITHILCTDIACDGMMKGPNFNLYEEAIERFPAVRWQASGGVRHWQDIQALEKLGVNAVILGRLLYESDFDLSGAIDVSEANYSLS